MTDIDAKIANVKKKAVAWRRASFNPDMSEAEYHSARRAFVASLSPDLIIAWAEERERDKARIAELEKALKPFAITLVEDIPEMGWPTADDFIAASRALNGERQ